MFDAHITSLVGPQTKRSHAVRYQQREGDGSICPSPRRTAAASARRRALLYQSARGAPPTTLYTIKAQVARAQLLAPMETRPARAAKRHDASTLPGSSIQQKAVLGFDLHFAVACQVRGVVDAYYDVY